MKRFFTILLLMTLTVSCDFEEEVSSLDFLDPSNLPMLRDNITYKVSSFDTTGGNNDRINIHPGETAEIANK